MHSVRCSAHAPLTPLRRGCCAHRYDGYALDANKTLLAVDTAGSVHKFSHTGFVNASNPTDSDMQGTPSALTAQQKSTSVRAPVHAPTHTRAAPTPSCARVPALRRTPH